MPDRQPDDAPLSPELAHRRDEMLAELLPEVPRAVTRRRARRATVLSACGLTAIAIAVLRLPSSPLPPQSQPQPLATAPDSIARPTRATPPTDVAMLATDPGIVARLAAIEHPVRIERISDEVLLRTLSSIGRPTALVVTPSGPRLTADVADPVRRAM